MTVRILATSFLVGQAMNELGNRFPDLLVAPYRSPAWEEALPEAEALVVLLSESLSDSDLAKAPRLKAIGTFSVGTDHLPLEFCKKRGIRIITTPGVLTEATADIALALLLSVSRRIAEGERLVRSGRWTGWAPDQLLGTGLAGKVCGILGAGAIGKAFARRVWALGMQPVFWDREDRGGSVSFGVSEAPRAPLTNLLESSAVLSIHCPLSDQTRELLGLREMERLPKGAMIINTARGGILDEPAAIALLRAGHLGGVGLDVYAGEPKLHPAWLDAPRTVLLPHLGSATLETRAAMARLLCDGIGEALSIS